MHNDRTVHKVFYFNYNSSAFSNKTVEIAIHLRILKQLKLKADQTRLNKLTFDFDYLLQQVSTSGIFLWLSSSILSDVSTFTGL